MEYIKEQRITIDLTPKRIIIHKRKIYTRFSDPERKHRERCIERKTEIKILLELLPARDVYVRGH